MRTGKYHLITLGCQMNKSDSERIMSVLDGIGMERAADESDADFVLFNSCSVRKTAEDRVFGKIQGLKKLKEKDPKLVIGVTGCMPGRDHDGALRAKLPLADLFFPTSDLPQLPRWLAELRPDIVGPREALNEDYLKVRPKYANRAQAYVPVQTGCDKFCTYCVVPFARGRERNRPVVDIIGEIRGLASGGTLEVTLLGQTVNSYRAPDPESFSAGNPYEDHFAALLWEVNQVSGIERIHFTGPHPVHMTDEVIDALALPKHANFLHLPVQSGSDEVLRRMNRRYTAGEYLDIIRKVRVRRPGIAIGTDIIVGFCGETEEQFQETMGLYKEADFDISYTAMYSPRSGTAAFRAFEDDVPWEEKKRRWKTLHYLTEETVLRKNQEYAGKTVQVLVETYDNGICGGNSRELKRVHFASEEDLRGKLASVRIKKALEWLLSGERLP